MSFGKDDSNLGKVAPFGGSFGQRAHAITNARKAKREGGGGYWYGGLKLKPGMSRWIRLIPGNFLIPFSEDQENVEMKSCDHWFGREHFHGASQRSAICSAGPLFKNKTKREPCRGCDIFWEDYQRNEGKKRSEMTRRISMRDMYAFTVWDYGLWLQVPDRGTDGKEYKNWEPVDAYDPRVTQLPCQHGRLVHWPIGQTYYDYLKNYNRQAIRHDCAGCGYQGSIRGLSLHCGNCGSMLYDLANSVLSPEQRDSIELNKQTCPHCGHTGYTMENVMCLNCTGQGGTARRADIFDIDMELTAVPSQGTQTALQVLNRSNPRVIQVADQTTLQEIKSLDLEKIFASATMERQIAMWGALEVVQPPMQQFASQQQYYPQQMGQQYPQQMPPPQYYPPQGYAVPPMQQTMAGMPMQGQPATGAVPMQPLGLPGPEYQRR